MTKHASGSPAQPLDSATDVHSVLVHGDRAARETRAVSPPIWQTAALWASEVDADKLARAGIAPGLLRYSAGIESANDLIADLDAALHT